MIRVRPEYREPGSWFLLHDNAPSHRSIIGHEFLTQKQVTVFNQPPYLPDLAPCGFFLFPKLKMALKGCCALCRRGRFERKGAQKTS